MGVWVVGGGGPNHSQQRATSPAGDSTATRRRGTNDGVAAKLLQTQSGRRPRKTHDLVKSSRVVSPPASRASSASVVAGRAPCASRQVNVLNGTTRTFL